jgi:predicted nucleotidyltransferase component of viral defense system
MMKICQDIAGQGFAQKYYLSGGTALALQIEHRKSIDLDFFTAKDIDVEELIAWLDHHYSEKDAEIVFRKSDQIDFRILGTKISFIHYPFALINNLIDGVNISPGFKGLRISPDREIALMKAYVLGRRTSFRDYIDLYYLLKLSCTSIEEIIKDCSKKYVIDGEKVFSEKLFLQQLAYTEDITDKQEALSLVLERSLAAETVENFLRSQVAVYMRTLGNRDKDEGGL